MSILVAHIAAVGVEPENEVKLLRNAIPGIHGPTIRTGCDSKPSAFQQPRSVKPVVVTGCAVRLAALADAPSASRS